MRVQPAATAAEALARLGAMREAHEDSVAAKQLPPTWMRAWRLIDQADRAALGEAPRYGDGPIIRYLDASRRSSRKVSSRADARKAARERDQLEPLVVEAFNTAARALGDAAPAPKRHPAVKPAPSFR